MGKVPEQTELRVDSEVKRRDSRVNTHGAGLQGSYSSGSKLWYKVWLPGHQADPELNREQETLEAIHILGELPGRREVRSYGPSKYGSKHGIMEQQTPTSSQ